MSTGLDRTDTIFAVASGAGRGAVTLLRISGPGTRAVVAGLCPVPPARRLSLRVLRHIGASGAVDTLDHALVAWMPGPDSYTGEDQAELHLHGGRAVLDAVSRALVTLGARPAEAGEFTRRAYRHGRMDLLEAEGVADLVAACTDAQRRQALSLLEGRQSLMLATWRERLLRLLAAQEALIDFPDEALPPSVDAALNGQMAALEDELTVELAAAVRGERLRDGLTVAIVGAPNVGKSSLINYLAAADIAIVSPVPGTTRDPVTVTIDVAGVPVTFVDTAGLRETTDAVEAEGVRRARARADDADTVLHLVEAGHDEEAAGDDRTLRVVTKVDLGPAAPGALGISVVSGEGLAALHTVLAERVGRLAGTGAEGSLSSARHRAALLAARNALHSALDQTAAELRGEELRLAMHALGRIGGAVGVEDVLGEIFGRFCIGK